MAVNDKETTDLLKRIADGEHKAENILFKKLEEKINLIVRFRSKNISQEDKEDIISSVQIALLEALRLDRFDPSKQVTLNTYIAGIAQKQVALFYRKLKQNNRYFQNDMPSKVEDPTPAILEYLLKNEERERLRRKLSRLRPHYQKVLLMTFHDGKSTSEIAKKLKLTNKQVIDLKFNALKKLADVCKKDSFFSIFSILLQILL